MTEVDAKLEARANDLYWNSDKGVNTIADELGLSKGTLYNVIEPLSAGRACPACDGELEYPNRTAREQGMVVCASCDYETSIDELEVPSSGGGSLSPSEVARQRTIIGGALLGAAAGLALVFWNRRS